ncbi:MAG: NAD-dependent epimerase/dehydratase family protein [Nitrososphaerota archaeon]|jgi:nucleoside-diphosphate-sugar epimerase|nr:NAD-dependent epimerase/dehydratase family protein [Nitrososphaerota archaeon]
MSGTTVIFGADGYIGWPLALHLGTTCDEKVVLVDNFITRQLVSSVRSDSLVPIRSMKQRLEVYRRFTGKDILIFEAADARDPDQVDSVIRRYLPSTVVHLAQQRSAPFSMIDQDHALYTQLANTSTNLNIIYSMIRHVPRSHLLKMGSMGEYGTPGVEIKEGEVELNVKGRKSRVMFPRSPGSWYHISKVFDTYNVLFANKIFSLTSTDVMQGVVYGSRTEEIVDDALATRFDFDSIWGTVINKYVIQAVLLNKLLIYGKGRQKRGFLSLYDSINCLSLLVDNPPDSGRYRVVNQLDEVVDTVTLADLVRKIALEFGISVDMEQVPNPRVEAEDHYYEVESRILPSLGFRRRKSMEQVIREIFETVIAHRARAESMKELIYPTVSWRSSARVSQEFHLPSSFMFPFTPRQILDYYAAPEVDSKTKPELRVD